MIQFCVFLLLSSLGYSEVFTVMFFWWVVCSVSSLISSLRDHRALYCQSVQLAGLDNLIQFPREWDLVAVQGQGSDHGCVASSTVL